MILPSAYFDQYAWGPAADPDDRSYSSNWQRFGFQVFQQYLDELSSCGLSAPKTVLDVGCANGNSLRELASQGIKARGIESSPYMYKYAGKDVKPWIKFGDAIKILPKFKDNAFDTVFDCVSQYLSDDELSTYFDQIYRVTKTDLVIMVSTTDFASGRHKYQIQFKSCSFWRHLLKKHGFIDAGDPDSNVYWFQKQRTL